MDKITIRGGTARRHDPDRRAKNAALPLMAASLLSDEPLVLSNVPHLADITTMANLLGQHGVRVSLEGHAGNGGHTGRVMSLTAGAITSTTAPYDLVRKMRASVLVLGPLLARRGEATVSLPGGCAIGTRPVDLHLGAWKRSAPRSSSRPATSTPRAPDGLRGARCVFPQGVGRRDREPDDGGDAGARHHGAGERGARARDHRPRSNACRDGREDRRASAPRR